MTNLNPTGPGSFQAALDVLGPRIIVFEVSGVIPASHGSKGKRYFTVGDSNLTIAGQTAPGAGITLDGTLSFLRGGKQIHNVVIRFLRIRTGTDDKSCYLGRANIRGLEASPTQRLIVDHVSASWSLDDCFDLYTVRDATVQWCTIEESDIVLEGGDEPHNFGLITGWASGGPRPISIHHTLIANHRERTPCIGSFPTDFRNNVIYNAGSPTIFSFLDKSGKYKPDEFVLNIVGNYLRPGPGGLIGTRVYMPPTTFACSIFEPPRSGRIYASGNYEEYRRGYAEPWAGQPQFVETEHPFPKITTHTADEALELVMACAGCLPRDAVTSRTIAEVTTGTGSWGRHDPAGGLMEGLTPGSPPPDTDNDGMPDAWETAHGLDPQNPEDANKIVPAGASKGERHRGYTFIEYYVNELADQLVARALTETRLNREPARPWNSPATGLARGAQIHDTLEAMVQAVREQTTTREPSTDTHAAWFAVQQLERMGEKAVSAVPELVKLLESSDPRTTAFTAWALGAIGPAAAEAVPALITVLERQSDTGTGKWVFNERGFAAWAIGRIGPPAAAKAVRQLAKILEGDDARAKAPALWALSRLGPAVEPARSALLRNLDHNHAAEALAQLGASIVPDLLRIITGNPKELQLGAIKALGRIGPEARIALPALFKAARDHDVELRACAAFALGRIGGAEETVATLAALLKDSELAVRHAAALALQALGPQGRPAIPALEMAFSDPRPEVRRAVLLALGKMGPETVLSLQKALTHRDALVRRHAARALGLIGTKAKDAAPDVMRMLLTDRDPLCRREAVWTLTLMEESATSSRDALRKSCDDDDYVVRYAAEAALNRIR